jgi:DNA-binding Lrp family transcriptional regulator
VNAHDLAPGIGRIDAALIDYLHDGFPLCDRPFARIGQALGLGEDEVLERLRGLLASGVLTRLGPLYQIERAGGAYLLAALEVPAARFDVVAARVNAHLEVAHNYRREHRLNMWFVLAADSQDAVEACARAIEAETGLPVHRFPKLREYHVELRLRAAQEGA